MKLKNLLIAIAVFFSWNAFSQQTQGPNSISQGTFMGTTIALRDILRRMPLRRSPAGGWMTPDCYGSTELFQRSKPVDEVQIGFTSFFVRPLYEALGQVKGL